MLALLTFHILLFLIWPDILLYNKWSVCVYLVQYYKCTFRRDLFPRVRRVHEGGIVDLIINVLILVERERSTQANIHDHTNRPHVKRAIVSLVQEDLRGQVSRRAHDRTAERLLSNDASKTEITKFHLWKCNMCVGRRVMSQESTKGKKGEIKPCIMQQRNCFPCISVEMLTC